uniref:Conotoxin ba-2281 n=1 Tax=Conus bayani TaxID=2070216 RepID=CU61_CONBY|nr:RecName: Full=Conotoxin ba-2281; AltName: Full=Conotoxin ba6.1; Flags: Precursor [Conus bayani]
MNRMGFFLMLTAAVLLTSLVCTEATPADESKVKRARWSRIEGSRLFRHRLPKSSQSTCPYCQISCCPPAYCQPSGCRGP